jgi:hypothetical protein
MSEEAAVTSSAVAPVASGQTEDISQYIGTDGSLKEGWIDGLVPEDLRSEMVFKDLSNTNPNVKDITKMLGNLQKAIGKKGLIQPTDSSTPSEWDVFYKALGRPDKPDGYKLDYPKDMPTPEVPEIKKAFTELAYKEGFTQKQTASAFEFYNNLVRQSVVQFEQQQEQIRIDSETQLKTELGAEYENYIHWGNRLISENTQEG